MGHVLSEKYTKVLSFKEVLKISESSPRYDTSRWILSIDFIDDPLDTIIVKKLLAIPQRDFIDDKHR